MLAAALWGCGSRTALDVFAVDQPALDASGDAAPRAEASAGDGSALDVNADALNACPYHNSSCFAPPLPAFDDQCASASDCAIGFQGCCDEFAIGLRASQRSAFDAAKTMWSTFCCATVDCSANHVCSQQGLLCSLRGAAVACVAGRCRTQCR